MLRVEAKHFFNANLVIVEIRHLRLVAERPGFRAGHGLRLLFLQERQRLGLVEQRQQSRGSNQRGGLYRVGSHSIFEIQRKHGHIALDQLENIRALVPTDIEVRCRLAGERADGQEGRTFCVRELELPRGLPIGRHARSVNRANRAGKADGRDAIGRDGTVTTTRSSSVMR